MSRGLRFATITAIAAIGLTGPATAKVHRSAKKSRVLVMSVRYHRAAAKPLRFGGALMATPPPAAVLSFEGYKCEVTVGTGKDDQTPTNLFTTDSTEFYIAYTQGGMTFDSVTSNCIGKVEAQHSTHSIVTHVLTSCRQFNPFTMSGPTIEGSGISTTFPDGLYSETCNTPNFQH